ncbi:MAG: hypothetical protein ACR2LN_00690 [Candidatus Levyibacteriota bacterium]
MDPSANPSPNDQSLNRAQPPVTATVTNDSALSQPVAAPQPKIQTPTAISVNKESGPSVIVSENSGDNEEVQIASQETNNQGVQQQAGGEVQEIEVQPSILEPKIEASIEHVVEKSGDQEKPVIAEVVKQAGVTHSGPGIIPDTTFKIKDNAFGIKTLPITYQQAAVEEKKTEFKASKHWLMGTIMYVWRKVNPALGTKKQIN